MLFTGSGAVFETEEPCSRPPDELETAALLDYVERFNDLIDSNQYNMAAVHAANSPQGILRTMDTLRRLAGGTGLLEIDAIGLMAAIGLSVP